MLVHRWLHYNSPYEDMASTHSGSHSTEQQPIELHGYGCLLHSAAEPFDAVINTRYEVVTNVLYLNWGYSAGPRGAGSLGRSPRIGATTLTPSYR